MRAFKTLRRIYVMVKRINPVAKAMAHNRKRKQIVPNKKKYSRKRDNTIPSTNNMKGGYHGIKQQADSEEN